MKKLFLLLITLIMCITAVCFVGCGNSSSGPIDNPDVKLVDVNGLSTYDIKDAVSSSSAKAIKKAKNLSVTLKSHATKTEFVGDSSVINLSNIHKEYYFVDIKDGSKTIVTAKIDFHDVDNDGVIWCEWSDYVVRASRSNRKTGDVYTFEYVQETVGVYQEVEVDGEILVFKPKEYTYSLFGVVPFHSKEYYLEYAPNGYLNISFLRRAVYSYDNPTFDPIHKTQHFGHYDGEWAPIDGWLNIRHFGTSQNLDLGNVLNQWQEADFTITQLMEHYEDLGDNTKGVYWYLIGTSHGHEWSNPYKFCYYFSGFDVIV